MIAYNTTIELYSHVTNFELKSIGGKFNFKLSAAGCLHMIPITLQTTVIIKVIYSRILSYQIKVLLSISSVILTFNLVTVFKSGSIIAIGNKADRTKNIVQ